MNFWLARASTNVAQAAVGLERIRAVLDAQAGPEGCRRGGLSLRVQNCEKGRAQARPG